VTELTLDDVQRQALLEATTGRRCRRFDAEGEHEHVGSNG
jgi:hypothetical protein